MGHAPGHLIRRVGVGRTQTHLMRIAHQIEWDSACPPEGLSRCLALALRILNQLHQKLSSLSCTKRLYRVVPQQSGVSQVGKQHGERILWSHVGITVRTDY